MSAPPLLVEREGAVARLVLNRPDAGNTVDAAMAEALMHAATACDEDEGVRCVVLTGRGKLFCGGGDIHAFDSAGERLSVLAKEITASLHVAVSRLARMHKPLVTSINGPAAGAGLSLAVLGDLAIAARSAHFTLAYTALGVSPDGGSTWLLPRLIGLRRTQEMLLLNPRVPAEAAAAMGLITRVVDDDRLEAETAAVAAALAGSATAAIGRARNLLLTSFTAGFETQMEDEARSIAECGKGAEMREGVAAFLAKRKPEFAGRGG